MACYAGFLTGRKAARLMLPHGRGALFFTGATASLRGGAGYAAFAAAKFGLRAVAQSAARELGPKHIHVAYLVIDSGVDTAWVRERIKEREGEEALRNLDAGRLMRPEAVAETYWQLYQQPRDAWTFELEIRPLRAGLETSPYVSVDDTGARHAGKNGFCTQIGNDWFTWFGTRTSKSRLNFLDLLRAGHTDYVVSEAAYDYMRKHSLSAPLIASLAAQPQTAFADQEAWLAHLNRLGFTKLDVTPDPVRVATEGALWGSVQAHNSLCNAVVLSDDAGQFNVGQHALCWVHAERLVHKLDTFTDQHRAAQTQVRGLIWDLYADLKTYRAKPGPRRAVALRKRFDRVFLRRTGFVRLDRLLKRLHANKAEALMVLDRPETPLQRFGE